MTRTLAALPLARKNDAEEESMMPQQTYKLPYRCDNCDHRFQADIQKGTPAPEKAECPNCGCEMASREHTNAPTLPIVRKFVPLPGEEPWVPRRPWRPGWPDQRQYWRERDATPAPIVDAPQYTCGAFN